MNKDATPLGELPGKQDPKEFMRKLTRTERRQREKIVEKINKKAHSNKKIIISFDIKNN